MTINQDEWNIWIDWFSTYQKGIVELKITFSATDVTNFNSII